MVKTVGKKTKPFRVYNSRPGCHRQAEVTIISVPEDAFQRSPWDARGLESTARGRKLWLLWKFVAGDLSMTRVNIDHVKVKVTAYLQEQ